MGGRHGGGSIDILFGGLGWVSLEVEREFVVISFGSHGFCLNSSWEGRLRGHYKKA